MKGHSRIELTDVRSGTVEVHEDDNLVTNGIATYLKQSGIFEYKNVLNQNKAYPYWRSLIGGIYLLDREVTESADNILLPSDSVVTGMGSLIANSDAVTEMGTWNAVESGMQEDGTLKLVWDFATSQANGTINSACLTSSYAGYVGNGNSNDQRYGEVFIDGVSIVNEFGGMYTSNAINAPVINSKGHRTIMYADYNENCIYYIDSDSIIYSDTTKASHWGTTGNVKINKYRMCLSAIDIRQDISDKTGMLLNTIDIAIPEEIINYIGTSYTNNGFSVRVDENFDTYILFWKNGKDIGLNESCKILKINSDYSTQVFTLTNTTDIRLQLYYLQYNFLQIHGGYLYVKGNGLYNYLVKIKLSDSTDASKVAYLASSFGNNMYTVYHHGNDICCVSSSNINGKITQDGKFLPMNGVGNMPYNMLPIKGNKLLYIYQLASGNSISLYKSHQYLATINNLQEPVVKTASKTMKVTYTITFD